MLYKIMEKNTKKISPDEEEIIFECEKKPGWSAHTYYLNLWRKGNEKIECEKKHDCTVRKININEFECKSQM